MKKRISAIFVLLTGTLLLALSALPHHHHGDRISFVAPERCVECFGHVPCCGGNDDHGGSDTDCDLRYLFVMYGRGGRTILRAVIIFPSRFSSIPFLRSTPAFMRWRRSLSHRLPNRLPGRMRRHCRCCGLLPFSLHSFCFRTAERRLFRLQTRERVHMIQTKNPCNE